MQTPSNPSNFKRITEIVAFILALTTGILGILDSRHDRKLEAYRKLGDSYVKIMELCLDKRCLDCYDVPNAYECPILSEADSLDRIHQQKVIYTIIVNHFEQAYKTLHNTNDLWPGWKIYIDGYLRREAFRNNWYDGDETWSKSFQTFMQKRIAELAKTGSINRLTHTDSLYLSFLKH